MTPRWAHSSQEHGVPREEQVHVLLHATYTRELRVSDPDRERITLYIGHPHAQTDREVEILVRSFPGTAREALVFHAMPLGPKYRRLREEHPDG
jgi:hypothetical protein